MNTIYIQYHKTPVGELIIGSFQDELCICDWRYRRMRTSIDKRIRQGLDAVYHEKTSPITETCILQLNEYFWRERDIFEIPLKLVGTDFQQAVWNELLKIPYGVTETYIGLSKNLNNDKAVRAVASANGANAISIIVPCHRIVGHDGKLVGYAGGLQAKKKLLQLEQSDSEANQLELF
jgi:methylated-DNA-[protein]-cysteine S-methyltransferase